MIITREKKQTIIEALNIIRASGKEITPSYVMTLTGCKLGTSYRLIKELKKTEPCKTI